jgi:hypothetical protein
MINTTPRPLYHRERLRAHCIGSWVGPSAGLYSPAWIRSLDHPSRSESLYRLSHCGPAEEFSIKRTIWKWRSPFFSCKRSVFYLTYIVGFVQLGTSLEESAICGCT